MADTVPPEVRSRIMAAVPSWDTSPELVVRRGLHARGFRYVLHDIRLPGRPDLAFPKFRAVIFVHGCFWHGHNCRLGRLPATNVKFWSEKLRRNRERDASAKARLTEMGWRALTVWDCALRGAGRRVREQFFDDIAEWLAGGHPDREIVGTRSTSLATLGTSLAAR